MSAMRMRAAMLATVEDAHGAPVAGGGGEEGGDEGEERAGEEFVGAGVGAVVGAVGVGVAEGERPGGGGDGGDDDADADDADLAGRVHACGWRGRRRRGGAARANRTVLRPRVTRTAGRGWWRGWRRSSRWRCG